LLARLGDDDFDVREKATAELKSLGLLVAPLLRQAVNHSDAEIRTRARTCLDGIEKDQAKPLSPVTVRLAALRKHPGTAAALLAFLPFAEDESMREEVRTALITIAYAQGKPEPALVRALDDNLPMRKAAAAEAL